MRYWLFFLIGMGLSLWAKASTPLIQTARTLRCSDDPQAIQAALSTLTSAPLEGLGVPDRYLGESKLHEVRASEIDILLDALYAARIKFPALSSQIDALVSSWDFCQLTFMGISWNVEAQSSGVQRTRPTTPPPLNGVGFLSWGLLPRINKGRPTAQASTDITIEPCVGDDIYEDWFETPSGALAYVPKENPAEKDLCMGPPVVATTLPVEDPPQKQTPTSQIVAVKIVPAPKASEAPDAILTLPPSGELMPLPSLSQTHEQKKSTKTHLSGSLSVRESLTGSLSLGAQASYSPFKGGFVRVGLSSKMTDEFTTPDVNAPTLSWGLGYELWEPNTWSLQVNHWGPITLDSGRVALTGAEADLGYKIKLPKKLSKHLALGARLNVPFSRAPGVASSLTLKLPKNFSATVGVRYSPFPESKLTWSYTAGYATWKPFSFVVSYANWGPNAAFEPNFVNNGGLSVGWLWKF
jgi:hypothetical protein